MTKDKGERETKPNLASSIPSFQSVQASYTITVKSTLVATLAQPVSDIWVNNDYAVDRQGKNYICNLHFHLLNLSNCQVQLSFKIWEVFSLFLIDFLCEKQFSSKMSSIL